MYKIDNWYKGLTLEFEMLHGARNVDHVPNTFYARAILVDPDTKIRYYQKLVTINFEEKDKLENL